MKIEKGKLYYDTTSSSFFKADEDGDNHNGFARNKIAVHCLNEQDYNYVSSVYKYKWYKDYNGRWDLVLFNGVDCISLCAKQRSCIDCFIEYGYQIITIEEFKKFYPEKEQQPIHFTISPEDYAEYQDLKKLKETLKKLIL